MTDTGHLVRHTPYRDSDSIADLCRTQSAVDPRDDDTDETRAARFSKRLTDQSYKLRKAALKRPYKTPAKLDHDAIRQMTADGMTPTQIGDRFGVRPGSISRVLRRGGQ